MNKRSSLRSQGILKYFQTVFKRCEDCPREICLHLGVSLTLVTLKANAAMRIEVFSIKRRILTT